LSASHWRSPLPWFVCTTNRLYYRHSKETVLESKADMQKRGQASPDDGDALALTFAQAVPPAEKEERDEDDEFGGHGGINGPGSWMR
jgi:hypothetical protein